MLLRKMTPRNYDIKVNVHGMPQKVASGFQRVTENLLGAKYEFVSYLGSKETNGINHALLCKQTLIIKKDITSLVLMILNEKEDDVRGESISIVEIETLISDTGLSGGYHIDPRTEIPNEIREVFDNSFKGFLGATNTPFALIATQVVNGMAYVFAVESDMIISPNAVVKFNGKSISLIKMYSNYNKVEVLREVLEGAAPDQENDNSNNKLGYAFTWLASDDKFTTIWP